MVEHLRINESTCRVNHARGTWTDDYECGCVRVSSIVVAPTLSMCGMQCCDTSDGMRVGLKGVSVGQ